jgi:post-segregation antitoxin (ccd killing protein)
VKDRSKRARYTVNLDGELIDRARDVVWWTPGLTLSSLTADALEREIRRLEKKRGEPFPKRKGKLIVGRPIGS